MGNYNVGNETKNGSRCVRKWKGVVCLAGLLICLVVGSFCVVTYGASAGEADGSESEAAGSVEDGDLPIQNMFDKCFLSILSTTCIYNESSHCKLQLKKN